MLLLVTGHQIVGGALKEVSNGRHILGVPTRIREQLFPPLKNKNYIFLCRNIVIW